MVMIKVKFEADVNSMLLVSAVDLNNGRVFDYADDYDNDNVNDTDYDND